MIILFDEIPLISIEGVTQGENLTNTNLTIQLIQTSPVLVFREGSNCCPEYDCEFTPHFPDRMMFLLPGPTPYSGGLIVQTRVLPLCTADQPSCRDKRHDVWFERFRNTVIQTNALHRNFLNVREFSHLKYL